VTGLGRVAAMPHDHQERETRAEHNGQNGERADDPEGAEDDVGDRHFLSGRLNERHDERRRRRGLHGGFLS
jgi:hypothetical protein